MWAFNPIPTVLIKRSEHIETQTQGQGCVMMEAETGEMQLQAKEDQGDTPGNILPWRSSRKGDPAHTLTEDFWFWHQVDGTLFPQEPGAQTLVQHIFAHSMGPGGCVCVCCVCPVELWGKRGDVSKNPRLQKGWDGEG